MLTNQTIDGLYALQARRHGHRASPNSTSQPSTRPVSFEERLGLLVDRELTERENRRLGSAT